jgi:hypothetical protein
MVTQLDEERKHFVGVGEGQLGKRRTKDIRILRTSPDER